jgi:hypothetical protein
MGHLGDRYVHLLLESGAETPGLGNLEIFDCGGVVSEGVLELLQAVLPEGVITRPSRAIERVPRRLDRGVDILQSRIGRRANDGFIARMDDIEASAIRRLTSIPVDVELCFGHILHLPEL